MTADLRVLLPMHEFITANDREHVPYGSRSDQEIISLSTVAVRPLVDAGCAVIVIACNTATMAAIAPLRNTYPHVQFIGTEPMIKPASNTSASHHITVLATPLTLASERYHKLKSLYGGLLQIDEPSAVGWASMIEHHQSNDIDFHEVTESIMNGSDTIVLACTHYRALLDRLHATFPSVTILEPTRAIAERIRSLTH